MKLDYFQRENLKYGVLLAVCIGFGLLLLSIHPVGALQFNDTEVGETWIAWEWNGTGPYYEVRVDSGTATNTTANRYFMTGLDPDTRHEIQVTDGTTTYSELTDTDKTFWQSWFFITLALTVVFVLCSLKVSAFVFPAIVTSIMCEGFAVSEFGTLSLMPIVGGLMMAVVFFRTYASR